MDLDLNSVRRMNQFFFVFINTILTVTVELPTSTSSFIIAVSTFISVVHHDNRVLNYGVAWISP